MEQGESQPKTSTKLSAACLKKIEDLTTRDPYAKYLLDSMKQEGCSVKPGFFSCEPCEPGQAAYFSPEKGVVICENNVGVKHMQRPVVHELIHAYDYCRVKNFNQNNCDQVACTEIRAATLSRDCDWTSEFVRGKTGMFKFSNHFEACIKRRAQLSVDMVPACKGQGVASVEKAWSSCSKDLKPFDVIP